MKTKSNLLKYEIFSTIFLFIFGTLLHFTFEFFNSNPIIGTFSAVNESTWEHLKLLFFPMLITTIIGYFCFRKDYPNYLCTKTKGILIGLAFIVIFFYTYTGIIGTNFAVLDIASFFIAGFLAHYYTYKNIDKETNCNTLISFAILIILSISFIVFTFIPPEIGLFKDPITNNYGIPNK